MKLEDRLPGLGPKTDRPRFNRQADLTAFRLTPTEGFLLSRIDGTLSYEQICRVVGLGSEEALTILRRLKSDGLIIGPGDKTPPPVVVVARGTPITGTQAAPRVPTVSLLERLDDHTPVDPIELVSGPDLAPELKMRIVRLHRRLKKLGPYDILGLPRDADRGAIKRAYYAASKELHPDRYYGKDLGIFREKLGDIFARLTEAFQSLDRK